MRDLFSRLFKSFENQINKNFLKFNQLIALSYYPIIFNISPAPSQDITKEESIFNASS